MEQQKQMSPQPNRGEEELRRQQAQLQQDHEEQQRRRNDALGNKTQEPEGWKSNPNRNNPPNQID